MKQIGSYLLMENLWKDYYGEYYLTKKNIDVEPKYITRIISKNCNPAILSEAKKDVTNAIANLNHRNILKFEAVFQTHNNYYIIKEYYNGGNLLQALKQYKAKKGKGFSEDIIRHLMIQIISVFKYLHEKDIFKNDINLGQILLNFETQKDKEDLNLLKATVKIGNFEKTVKYSDKLMNNKEYKHQQEHPSNNEFFSLGIICYQMITGELNVEILPDIGYAQKILISIVQSFSNLSEEIKSFFYKLITMNHEKCEYEKILEHEFLVGKNQNKYEPKFCLDGMDEYGRTILLG